MQCRPRPYHASIVVHRNTTVSAALTHPNSELPSRIFAKRHRLIAIVRAGSSLFLQSALIRSLGMIVFPPLASPFAHSRSLHKPSSLPRPKRPSYPGPTSCLTLLMSGSLQHSAPVVARLAANPLQINSQYKRAKKEKGNLRRQPRMRRTSARGQKRSTGNVVLTSYY